MTPKENWLWLAAGLGYAAVNSGDLLRAYPGGAEDIAADLGGDKLDEILTQKQAERLASSRPADFALRVAHAETQGITTLGYDDPAYPAMLRTISNPPVVLFVKGDVSLLNGQLSVGIVGARRPSAYGVEAVKAIGRGVALGGAIIVSGLAAGLDAEAHKAALAVNGPTIACIAFGHDNCYPSSNRKLMEVIERHGAVVSEYPLGTGAEKPFFLQRNRLIAGLSHALLVAEARRHSGTMSTVNFATDYGRDVFAVPGSIFSDLSTGTNAMIREGAYLAGSASDVLSVYGIELGEEDPVVAAARQAAEGRPAPAGASPPWQQSLLRYTDRTREEKLAGRAPDQLPGQQTLGEMLQGQLGGQPGQVSASRAIEAFRTLQQNLPAATGAELDARNRALDEMVAAVNDNVQIGRRASPAPARPEPPAPARAKGQVQPFRWDQVEHLDKREIEKLSSARGQGAQAGKKNKRSSLAARLMGGAAREGQSAAEPPAAPPVVTPREVAVAGAAMPFGGGGQPIEPVGRVGAVAPVAGVSAAAAVRAAAEEAAPPPAAAPQRARQEKRPQPPVPPPAAPAARPEPQEPRIMQPEPGTSFTAALTDKLRTLQGGVAEPLPPLAEGPGETVWAKPARPAAGAEPPVAEQPTGPAQAAAYAASAAEPARAPAAEPAFAAEPPVAAQPPTPAPRTEPEQALPAEPAFEPARYEETRPQTGKAPAPAPAIQAAGPEEKPAPPQPEAPEPPALAAPHLHSAPAPAPVAGPEPAPEPPAPPEPVDPYDLLSDTARRAYSQLGPRPVSLSAICERSGLSLAEAMAALTELELAGLSRQLAGRQFVIV